MEEDVKKADKDGWSDLRGCNATALHKVRAAIEFAIDKLEKLYQTALTKIEAIDCQVESG